MTRKRGPVCGQMFHDRYDRQGVCDLTAGHNGTHCGLMPDSPDYKPKPKGYYLPDQINDSGYHTLRGPAGFEATLGEPEDRNWYRDGKAVVDELNRLRRALEIIADDSMGGDDLEARKEMRATARLTLESKITWA